ncbi:MAG: hypothetical protein OEZ29_06615 [Candidatus Bathyarchaeota archaeon]|nr:hypothetical protein [Candidatus Bathyarchaeota archaeon]MDH5780252.1 hypothetical protein [Candidatus Bathyarchaeota archaeon]
MKKQTIIIISGLMVFLIGISLIGVSNVSRRGLVEYRAPSELRLEGSEIMDLLYSLHGPEDEYAGKYGLEFSGSFEGHDGEPIFLIRDYEDYPVFSGPGFDTNTPPSGIIDFPIGTSGFYILDFNVVAGNESRVELYPYKYQIGEIRPYVYLFFAGIPLAISGIVANVVGLFVLSKPKE